MRKSDRSALIRRSTALSLAALLAACAQQPPVQESSTTSPGVSPADELLLVSARVALPPEGTTIADLPDPDSPGALAEQRYCTACHALPHPTMHSATDWPGVVRRMWLRMGMLDPKYGVPAPEMGQRIVLLDYLTANALKVSSNLPAGPDRQIFIETCSRCHDLPDPRQHSEQDWFVVVRRMNQHMQDILGTTVAPDEIDRIVGYLTTAGGGTGG